MLQISQSAALSGQPALRAGLLGRRLLASSLALCALTMLGAACGGTPTGPVTATFLSGDETRYFNAALEARQAGDAAAVEQNLGLAIQANPRFQAAHIALGDHYYALDRYLEARDAYVRAVEIRSQTLDAQLGASRTQLKLGALDDALHHATRAVELTSTYATGETRGESLLVLGEVLLARNDLEAAADALTQAMAADSSNTMARIQMARMRSRAGDNAEAMRVLARAETYETDPDLLRELGRLYYEMRVDDRASDALTKAREGDPSDDETLYLLATTTMRMGNRDVGIQLASELIARTPSYLDAYTVRGRGELRRNAPERARQDATMVLAQNPRHFDALLLLGTVEQEAGNLAQAEQHYRAALVERPGDIDGLDHLGRLLHGQQRWADYVRDVGPHAQLTDAPASWRPLYFDALLSTGDYPAAVALKSQIALAAPTDALLNRDAARLSLEHPGALDPQQTLRHARIAVERSGGGTMEFRLLLVDALMYAQEWDEASRQLQLAESAWPSNPQVHERRSRLRDRR